MPVSIPEFEFVLRDLSFLWPICYSALDYGAYQTLEFFKDQKIDPHLGAHLVRYFAKEALIRDNGGHYKIENVSNSGLFLNNTSYNIRLIKTRSDKLPPPRYSECRRKYYRQEQQATWFPPLQLCFPLPEFQEYQTGDKLNLVILWDLDPQAKYKIGPISLACPKDGGMKQDSVVAYWHNHVPQEFINGTVDVLQPVVAKDLPLTFFIETETGE